MLVIQPAPFGQQHAIGQRQHVFLSRALKNQPISVRPESVECEATLAIRMIRIQHRIDDGLVSVPQAGVQHSQAGFPTNTDGEGMGQLGGHPLAVDPLQGQ
ncbi:hypothetical protein D3C86_1520110 [compost metagenome]